MSRWNWIGLALLTAAAGCACMMWGGPGGEMHRAWESFHEWGAVILLIGGFIFAVASFFVGEFSVATLLAALVIGGLCLLILANLVRHVMA